jgi:choline dehydrogenase-like flavoprotein
MTTIETDVLIIGTGFGAAAPALRLAQAGLRVTMIEKGPRIDPWRDFRQTSDPQYLLKYLHGLSSDHLSLTYAEALGGASGFYEMVSLRAPSMAFDQEDGDGRRLWPGGLDRRALDPYYDVAEEMLHVTQIPVERIPKTGLVFAMMMKNLGYSCDRARYAERGCIDSGYCVTGCIYGAKQSLLLTYLPQAVAAGAVIETDLEALNVRTIRQVQDTPRSGSLRDIPYRYRVWCRERRGAMRERRYHAKIVVLAGGTVGTAALLLASREQLPLLSPHVGRNIAFNGSVKAAGVLPEGFPDADMFTGRTHPGMISYQFLESHGITVSAAKAMPLQLLAGHRLRLDGDSREPSWWGEANVELMKQLRRRVIALYAMGLTPPAARLTAGPRQEPQVALDPDPRLQNHRNRTGTLLRSILARSGCRLLDPQPVDRAGSPHEGLYFSTAHQVGSCRMADSKQHGVTDAAGEVFEYPGLYVSDGSVIPSSLAVNTSLTILANAERIAAGMLRRYRRPMAVRAS